MDFSDILHLLKSGEAGKVARSCWGGGEFVVLQRGYPDGIPANKNTANAFAMKEGDLFVCNPYFQKRNADGSHSMWSPLSDDCLAFDWVIVQ